MEEIEYTNADLFRAITEFNSNFDDKGWDYYDEECAIMQILIERMLYGIVKEDS